VAYILFDHGKRLDFHLGYLSFPPPHFQVPG
jgi:hypothetical protein